MANSLQYYYLKDNGRGKSCVFILFTYDGWGNILTTGGYDANLASRNPLRYRGYYYDSETGLYYLRSRYYDPELGRFICADGYATTYNSAAGANMFAYCLNSTILFRDDQGTRRVMVDVGVETYGPNGRATAHLHAELTGEKEGYVQAAGVEGGAAFVVRGSASYQHVWDSKGNTGVAITFFFGGGTPNAYAGINYVRIKGNSIYDLAGTSWDVGGGSIEKLGGLGIDVQEGGAITTSFSKSLLPYEMHGGVSNTVVISAVDLLHIQDEMVRYGGGMYQ